MSVGATHQSLRRAVAILRVFTEREPSLGVGEIARRLGLHKSTVSRILATLLDEGLVWHNSESGQYSLGMDLVELAGVALGQIDVRGAAMLHMEALRELVDETVTLAVLRGHEAVTVAHVPTAQSVRHVVWIGRRVPLPTTASGKVFLAAARDAGQDWTELAQPVALGPEVVGLDDSLAAELDQVSVLGFATEAGDYEEGTSAVAAPIMDVSGAVVAALSVAAPSFRFGPDEMAFAGKCVADAAVAIGADLGLRRAAARGGERLG